MGELLEAHGIEVEYFLLPQRWSLLDMSRYDLILVASYLRAHRPIGCNGYNTEHQNSLYFLQNNATDKTVAVAYGSPHVYFDYFTGTARAFLAAYDYTKPLQEAVVSVLLGESEPLGKCPYELIPDFFRNSPFS